MRATIGAWTKCPKKLKNDLVPEAAVKHADKVLGVDDRMRIWQHAHSPYGLMYTCQQAQIQWNSGNPIGMLLLLRSCRLLFISTGFTVVCYDHSCKHHSLLKCCETSHCCDRNPVEPCSMASGIFKSKLVATCSLQYAYATRVFELLNKVHLHVLIYKPCTCHAMLGPGLITFLKKGGKPVKVRCLSNFDHTLRQSHPGHILPQSILHPLLLD